MNNHPYKDIMPTRKLVVGKTYRVKDTASRYKGFVGKLEFYCYYSELVMLSRHAGTWIEYAAVSPNEVEDERPSNQ